MIPRMSRFLPILASTLVSLSLAAQSSGITTGDLKGFCLALDPAGEVPGVTLRLAHAATNQTRVLVSDAKGEFIFRLLPPGMYTLTVEKPGFKTQIISGVRLSLASTANVDLLMETGVAAATVEVIGDATIVDPNRTQVSTVVDNNLINNLPINRRNFVDFSLTAPGVATANSPDNGGASANSGLTFAGANPRQNNVMVDGMDNNDIATGSVRTTFSQEAIQEFQVVTNGFSAEYGRAAGGTVNVITKSGGNDISGSTFFFRRDAKFDAKRPLAGGEATPFTRNQYGATVSGAIVKDRLFYFASVERLTSNDTNNVTISQSTVDLVKSVTGFQIQRGAIPWIEVVTTGVVKFDFNQSADSRWGLRLTWAKEFNENQVPWGGLTDRSSGGARRIEDKSVSLSNQWNASASFINDFRLLASLRDHALISLDDTQSPYVEILGAATYGTQRFLPQPRTEQTIQVADTASFFLSGHSLKVGADMLRTHAKGTLPSSFAGIYRFQAYGGFADGIAAFNSANPFGATFNGQPMRGMPAIFVQGFGSPYIDFTVDYTSLFLQDDWQITPKFTLKMGVRYDQEKLPPFRGSSDYDALENPPPASAGIPGLGPYRLPSGSIEKLFNTYSGSATGNGPYDFDALLRPSRNWSSSRVSPRVSFTWQAAPTTRVYGGYGVFSGRTQLGLYGAVAITNGTIQQAFARSVAGGASPWASWAGADGGSLGRFRDAAGNYGPMGRYASSAAMAPTGEGKIILLPGESEMPQTRQSSLGLEYSPKPNLRFTLDLIHSIGSNFLQARDVNAAIPIPAAYLTSATPTLSQLGLRRPDLRYSSVFRFDGSGESRYDAQTLSMAWQGGETLSLTASYTHAKTEDNYLDWLTQFAVQNTFDPKAEMATSSQNQEHKFVTSLVWNTQNLSSVWTKNWTLALIGKITSGRPYTVYTGVDADYGTLPNGTPVGNGEGLSAPADRPPGVPRNSGTTPNVQNLDIRFSRTFAFNKEMKLEVIGEFFNVFNHYNVSKVQNYQTPVPGAPAFGSPIIQSNVDFNRQFQAGLKISF